MSSSFVKDCSDSSSAISSNTNKTVIIIVNNDGGNVSLDGNDLQNLLASHGADSSTQVSVVQMGQGGSSTDSLSFPAPNIQGADASELLTHGLMPFNFTVDGFSSIALEGATLGGGYAELPLDADALRRLERVLDTEEAREFLGEPLLDIVNDPNNLLEPFERMMSPCDDTASASDASPSKPKRSSPKRRSQRQMDKEERAEVEKILAENQLMLQQEREFFRKIQEEKEDNERKELESEYTAAKTIEEKIGTNLPAGPSKKVGKKVSVGKGKKKNADTSDCKGKKLNSILSSGKGKKLNANVANKKGKKINTTTEETKVRDIDTSDVEEKGKKINTNASVIKGKKINITATVVKGKKIKPNAAVVKGKMMNINVAGLKGKKINNAITENKINNVNTNAVEIKGKKPFIKGIAPKALENNKEINDDNVENKISEDWKGTKKLPMEQDSEEQHNVKENPKIGSNIKGVKMKPNPDIILSHDDNSNIMKELPLNMKRLSVKVKKLDVRDIEMSHEENCSHSDREDVDNEATSTSFPPNQEELFHRLAPTVEANEAVGLRIEANASQGLKDKPRLKNSSLSSFSSPPKSRPHNRIQSPPAERKRPIINRGNNVVVSTSSPTKTSSFDSSPVTKSIISDRILPSELTDKSRTCDDTLSGELLSDNISKPKTNSNILMSHKNFSDVDPVIGSQEPVSSQTVSSTTTTTSPPRRKIQVITPAEAKSVIDISGNTASVKKAISAVNIKKGSVGNKKNATNSNSDDNNKNSLVMEGNMKKSKVSFENQLNLGNFATKVQKNNLKLNLKNNENSVTSNSNNPSSLKSPNILQHTPSISKSLMNYKIPLKNSSFKKNLEFKENSCPSQSNSSHLYKSNSCLPSPVLLKKTPVSDKCPSSPTYPKSLSPKKEVNSIPFIPNRGYPISLTPKKLNPVSCNLKEADSVSSTPVTVKGSKHVDSQITSSILQRKNSQNINKANALTKTELVVNKPRKIVNSIISNEPTIDGKVRTEPFKSVQKNYFHNKPEMAAKSLSQKSDSNNVTSSVQAVRRSIRPIKKKKFADEIVYMGKHVNSAKVKEEREEDEETDEDADSEAEKNVPFKKLQVETLDSSSEEYDSDMVDDDPGRLWCICQRPHNNRFMICCDRCEDWFHGSCVGVSKQLGKEMEEQECEWICPNCKKAERATKGLTSPPLPKINLAELYDPNAINKYLKNERKTVVMFDMSTGVIMSSKKCPDLNSVSEFMRLNPNYRPLAPPMMPYVQYDSELKCRRIPLHCVAAYTASLKKQKTSSFQDIIDSANKSVKKENKPIRYTKFLEHSEVVKLEHDVAKKSDKQSSKKSSKSKEEESSKSKEEESSKLKEEKSSKSKEEKSSKKIGSSLFYNKEKSNKDRKHSIDRIEESPSCKKISKESKRVSKSHEDVDKVIVKPDSIVLVRSSVQKMLLEALEKRISEAETEFKHLNSEHLKKLCKDIEEQLYLVFNKDVGFKYKSRYRSLVFNIRDTKNEGLFRNILNGTIAPEKLACLTSEEMASKELIEWREKEEKKELEAIQKHELERLALGNQYIMKSHKGEIMIDKDDFISKNKDSDSVINLAPDQSKSLLPVDTPEDEVLTNHKNHIYDPNCRICASSELHEFALSRKKEQIASNEQPDKDGADEVKQEKEKRNKESSKQNKKKDKERHRSRSIEEARQKHSHYEKRHHKDKHKERRSSSSDEERRVKKKHHSESERDSYEDRKRHKHKENKHSRSEKKIKEHRKRKHSESRSEDRKRRESRSSSDLRESVEDINQDNLRRNQHSNKRQENGRMKDKSLIITSIDLERELHPSESKVSTSDDVVFISQNSIGSPIDTTKDIEPTSTVVGTPVNDGCAELISLSPAESVPNTDTNENGKSDYEELDSGTHGTMSYSPDISPSTTPPPQSEPDFEEIFSPATPPLPDDEDEDRLTPPPVSKKPQKTLTPEEMPIWKGIISMPEVSRFGVTCFEVSGKPMFVKGDLHHAIDVVGRISPDNVWSYIAQQKKSGSKEILVVRFQPGSEDEKASYISFYSYLSNKRRYGVIGNCGKTIKDFYIVPLASHQPIPQILLPLDGPGFEESRPHMLIGVIVRVKHKKVYDPISEAWITNDTPKPRTYSFDKFDEKEKIADADDSIDEQSYTPPPTFGYESKANRKSIEELDSESFTPPSEDVSDLAEDQMNKEESEKQDKLDRESLLAELNRTIERDKRELSEMQKKAELKMEERERELEEEEANFSDSHTPSSENVALDTSKINIPSNLLEILNNIKQKEEAIKIKEDEIRRRIGGIFEEDPKDIFCEPKDVFSGSKDVDLRLLLPRKPEHVSTVQDQDMRLLTTHARIPVAESTEDKDLRRRDPRIVKTMQIGSTIENEAPSLSSMSDADLLAKVMEMEGAPMEETHLVPPRPILPPSSVNYPLIPPHMLPPHAMINPLEGPMPPAGFGPVDEPRAPIYGPELLPPPTIHHSIVTEQPEMPSPHYDYNRPPHNIPSDHHRGPPHRDYPSFPPIPDGDMRQMRDIRSERGPIRDPREQPPWDHRERRGPPEDWDNRFDDGYESGRLDYSQPFPSGPDRYHNAGGPEWFNPEDRFDPHRKRRYHEGGRGSPRVWRNNDKRPRRDGQRW